jgi:hypothetical protein
MPDPEELGRRHNAVGVSDAPTALETSSNNLIQVMRAVEDAEATIRQQVASLFFLVYDGLDYLTLPHVLFMFSAGGETRLKDELMLKTQELQIVVSDPSFKSCHHASEDAK